MDDEPDDHKRGGFTPRQLGTYDYKLEAWIDEFETWRRALTRKVEARQDVAVELQIGAALVSAAASRAERSRRPVARRSAPARASRLSAAGDGTREGCAARARAIGGAADGASSRPQPGGTIPELRLTVDAPKALFSSWYELFPRSWARRAGPPRDVPRCRAHAAVRRRDGLRRALPAAHPPDRPDHRKGKNNALTARPNDPGSPWAIGSAEGGHKAIHPELGHAGGLSPLRRRRAASGVDDRAGHRVPVLAGPPVGARSTRSGSSCVRTARIQYAENPPKKYEDIYPFNFETRGLARRSGRS